MRTIEDVISLSVFAVVADTLLGALCLIEILVERSVEMGYAN